MFLNLTNFEFPICQYIEKLYLNLEEYKLPNIFLLQFHTDWATLKEALINSPL